MGVEVEIAGGVSAMRLARPEKKNALTDAMYHALADAMAAADADDAVGAHLFLGSDGVFTAGNDIADFLAIAAQGGDPAERGVARFLMALIDAEKPMVAAVDGLAVGVGATLLLHCDLVYASERAELRAPFIDLGLVPENASSLLGPRVMGHQRAFAFLCLGAPLGAEAAREAGLVNEVLAAAGVEARAREMAERAASKPREAMALSRALLKGDREAVRAASLAESRIFFERLGSAEARAAFAAFMQRSGR